MGPDEVKVNCDATSIRSFITYIVKRHDGSARRDSCLRFLYMLFCYVCFVGLKFFHPLDLLELQ